MNSPHHITLLNLLSYMIKIFHIILLCLDGIVLIGFRFIYECGRVEMGLLINGCIFLLRFYGYGSSLRRILWLRMSLCLSHGGIRCLWINGRGECVIIVRVFVIMRLKGRVRVIGMGGAEGWVGEVLAYCYCCYCC